MLDSTTQKPLNAFRRLKDNICKTFIYQMIFHPIRSIKLLVEYLELLGKSDDEKYFYLRHKQIFGYKPDFKHPQTFNEKLIYRTLYDRNPIYTALSDKLKMRIYVAHKLQKYAQDSNGIIENGGGGEI